MSRKADCFYAAMLDLPFEMSTLNFPGIPIALQVLLHFVVPVACAASTRDSIWHSWRSADSCDLTFQGESSGFLCLKVFKFTTTMYPPPPARSRKLPKRWIFKDINRTVFSWNNATAAQP